MQCKVEIWIKNQKIVEFHADSIADARRKAGDYVLKDGMPNSIHYACVGAFCLPLLKLTEGDVIEIDPAELAI